jgi:hypothetical protein
MLPLLLLPVGTSAFLMASPGLPGAWQVAMIVTASFHLWSCGGVVLGLGVLAGMSRLLAGFQHRRRGEGITQARAPACSS